MHIEVLTDISTRLSVDYSEQAQALIDRANRIAEPLRGFFTNRGLSIYIESGIPWTRNRLTLRGDELEKFGFQQITLHHDTNAIPGIPPRTALGIDSIAVDKEGGPLLKRVKCGFILGYLPGVPLPLRLERASWSDNGMESVDATIQDYEMVYNALAMLESVLQNNAQEQ